MMIVTADSTDVTTYFHLRLAADGTDATGLTITNIDLQYVRSGAAPAAKVDATALAATDSAHSDNKAIEVDATDQPGLYRVDWPDAAFAAGVREVILTVKCATAFTESLRVQIISATRGLAGTALPNAAADAAGGLPISDAGGLDLDSKLANTNEVTAARMGALTDWINGGRLDLILDDILADTGTTLQSELDGIQADTEDIQSRLPAALTGDGNMKADVLAISGDGTAADNAEAAFDGNTYNVGGGAVVAASVTGAVGSVTGNVGGNVAGSVGSVTGNIGGNVTGSVGSVAAGGITATSIASDAIGSDELAASAANEIADAILARTLGTEAVSADGAVPTLAQALFEILAKLGEFSISGTTITYKKRDGSTTLFTATLDDATTPTSITRAT